MKNNLVFGIIIGVLLSFGLNVIANNIITSESVSYTNNKTAETTVNGALNELFSTVDINERLGSTDISKIGNGTVTGAIDDIDNEISKINNNLHVSSEVQIGVFNNKPLYRKVIKIDSVTMPSTSGLEAYTYYLNLDNPEIIWVNGVRIGAYQLPSYTAGVVTTYVATVSSNYNGAITLRNKEEWSNTSIYVDVTYTKTTD